MRHRREARTGRRRDNGVRQIRSNGAVRYPGVDLPADIEAEADASADAEGTRLGPALDTGLAVQSRLSRQQDAAARRQRTAAITAVAAVALLITATIAWRYVSDRLAAATPLASEASAAASPSAKVAAVHKTASAQSEIAVADATPIFASYGKLRIHLPVPMADLTEIGFHQASYPYALRMKTPLKDADLARAAKFKSTGRNLAKQPSGPDAVMTGYVLRMWRNRPGRPDTAADVGALAGTTVLAPVSGTIVKIKSYKLYGKYPDYELHIHPDGVKGLDLVMIHLTDLQAAVGDHVDAGMTPLAKVRKLSDKFHDQLADYTRGGGDHVHIQVNYAYYPGYRGLVGAISVPESGSAGSATGGSRSAPPSTEDSRSGDGDDSSSGD